MDLLELSLIFWEAYDSGTAIEIDTYDGRTFRGLPEQLYFGFVILDGLGYPLAQIRHARII